MNEVKLRRSVMMRTNLAGKAAGRAIEALQEAQNQLVEAQGNALQAGDGDDSIIRRERIERANEMVSDAMAATTTAIDHARAVVQASGLDVRRIFRADEAEVIEFPGSRKRDDGEG